MDLLNGLVQSLQHLEQSVGTFYNDITKSSGKGTLGSAVSIVSQPTSSQPVKDAQYWPVATASILDADDQYKTRRKALAAAQATYSTLVQQRLDAAEQLSILKQQRAKLPDKYDHHLENQMRKLLCDYKRLESDVFEARAVLVAAKKEDSAARSTGVAVFTGTSDTERLQVRSHSPVRAASPTQTSKDGVTNERRATLRSMSPTRVSSSPASHARVPSTASVASRLPSTESVASASSSSASPSNQFQRVRSSPCELIKSRGRPTRTVAGWQPAQSQVTVVNHASRPQIQRSLHGAEVHARLQDAASSRCGHPQAH